MYKFGLLFLAAIFHTVHTGSYTPRSITISGTVTRLDLSSGRISGEKADYFLDIPTLWSSYLTADREKLTSNLQPLEKLNFYFMPSDNNSKPALFLSMNIYNKHQYSQAPNHRKLLETERYIFTVYLPDRNSLESTSDIAVFNNMRSIASDDQYLIELILLCKGDEKLYNNTIWVNGKQLKTKAFTEGNVTYLPIRDVCELLGYKVGWLSDQQAITLRRGSDYEILLINDMNANKGFSIVFNNDNAFISSLYFISALKLNVEIDHRMNVMLNE